MIDAPTGRFVSFEHAEKSLQQVSFHPRYAPGLAPPDRFRLLKGLVKIKLYQTIVNSF